MPGNLLQSVHAVKCGMCNETLVATSGTLPFPQGRTRSPVHTSLLWFVNVKQHLSKAQLSKVKSYRFTRTTCLQKVAEQNCGVKLGPANFTSITSIMLLLCQCISPHHQNGGKKTFQEARCFDSTRLCLCVHLTVHRRLLCLKSYRRRYSKSTKDL